MTQVWLHVQNNIRILSTFNICIKRDPSQFTLFEHEGYWDTWNRETKATTNAHNVEGILDPTYIPLSLEHDLFQEKQKYVTKSLSKKSRQIKAKI